MKLKTIFGYAAISFVIFYVIKDPGGAAHAVIDIGNFLSSVANKFSAFLDSAQAWILVIPVAVSALSALVWASHLLLSRRAFWTPALVDILTRGLACIGVFLAGRQRSYLRESWRADLVKPRGLDQSQALSNTKKISYAASFVQAGVRCRMSDCTKLWWQIADRILASRLISRVILICPCLIAAFTIVRHEGMYGLITNAENLFVIGSIPATLVYGGRRLRNIKVRRPPVPPEKVK